MHIERKLAFTFLALLLATGCAQKLTPDEVTRGFWTAVEAGNAAAVRKYVSADARDSRTLGKDILDVTDISYGRVIIDGDRATVETTVVVLSDRPLSLPLDTVLVKEGSDWKVDYDATVSSVTLHSELAQVLDRVAEYGERFASELNRSMDDLQKALPQIEREVKRIEESFKAKIPELQKRIEEFAKSIEEALKVPPPSQAEPEEPTTTAI